MKKLFMALLMTGMLCTHALAAEPLAVGRGDSLANVLHAQTGKRVTLKLVSGDELTGTIKLVSDRVVHLAGLAGKEYFDAVVATSSVAALIVRVK